MTDLIHENASDRRIFERTISNRGALLCIPRLKNLFSFTMRDASERGIGMRLHSNCRLFPLEFMIVEERSWTVRQCRLIWRQGDFAGAEFVDRKKWSGVTV
jgi:hypothetical protein